LLGLLGQHEFGIAAALDHHGINGVPPDVVSGRHFLRALGVGGGQIVLTTGVFLHIEERPLTLGSHAPVELRVLLGVIRSRSAFLHTPEGLTLVAMGLLVAFRIVAGTTTNEQVIPLSHSSHGVFVVCRHSPRPAGDMVVEKSVVLPGDRAFGFEDGQKIEAFELRLECVGNLRARHRAEGRKDIEVGGEVVHLVRWPVSSPAPVGKRACASMPGGGFASAHVGVVDIEAVGLAVIRHEDDDGIFIELLLFQKRHQAADVIVEIRNHSEKLGLLVGDLAAKRSDELLRGGKVGVGRVGREVEEPRLVFGFGDELHRIIEEDVLAVSGGLGGLPIAHHRGIEVSVRPALIGRAPVESAVGGIVFPGVAEVPLADEAVAVSRRGEQLWERGGALPEFLAG